MKDNMFFEIGESGSTPTQFSVSTAGIEIVSPSYGNTISITDLIRLEELSVVIRAAMAAIHAGTDPVDIIRGPQFFTGPSIESIRQWEEKYGEVEEVPADLLFEEKYIRRSPKDYMFENKVGNLWCIRHITGEIRYIKEWEMMRAKHYGVC